MGPKSRAIADQVFTSKPRRSRIGGASGEVCPGLFWTHSKHTYLLTYKCTHYFSQFKPQQGCGKKTLLPGQPLSGQPRYRCPRARQYVRRIDFCYTPKHGSWLNVAECELSCLTSQCLRNRRIGGLAFLQSEIRAWSQKTNAKQRGVDLQFKIDDARRKLKRLYPKTKN
jgi:hypothetical protein